MRSYLSKIDTETGGNRNDVTPLFADREALTALAEDLASPFLAARVDAVVAIDALGFILGTAIADRLDVGVIPARKGGKLPVPTEHVEFVDYTGTQKSLEMRTDALSSGSRVLIVDEWIETGAQVRAAIELVERLGGVVVGIATIAMDCNPQNDVLRAAYRLHRVWED